MHDVDLRPDLPFNVVSLCAGGRGLDRALELAIPAARTVLYVERESFAVAGLVSQIENGLVAPAAVWSDVRTLNGRRWRGVVDCLIGGIPCQPHSLAGRRGGSTDERDLWSPARRLVAQILPVLVVIENVGGFLSAGADEIPGAERVWRDLQKLGYAVTGCIVRASDMGLPHERERVFVIGVADFYGRQSPGRGFGSGEAPCGRPHPEPARSGARVLTIAGVGQADACSSGLQGRGSSGGRSEECTPVERGGGGRLHARSLEEGFGAPDVGGRGQVVDAIGRGHDWRSESAIGRSVGRDAEQLAGANGGRPSLRPPGPGDAAAWRVIAEDCPELLPALSRYDRYRFAMRDEGLAPDSARPPAHLDPEARQRRAVEGGSPCWVDARTGEPVHPTRLQTAAQSALRRVADVMATRIDELRLLGNGVADAQGGLAIRIGLHDLAARGSAGAAVLVRMMEAA